MTYKWTLSSKLKNVTESKEPVNVYGGKRMDPSSRFSHPGTICCLRAPPFFLINKIHSRLELFLWMSSDIVPELIK